MIKNFIFVHNYTNSIGKNMFSTDKKGMGEYEDVFKKNYK